MIPLKRPRFDDSNIGIAEGAHCAVFIDFINSLEDYCDFLETQLKKQVDRTDYWVTQCTEARMLIKQLRKGRV